MAVFTNIPTRQTGDIVFPADINDMMENTQYVLNEIDVHATSTGTHGVTGAIVGTENSQILTNKTIDASANTVSNLRHGFEVNSPASGVHGVTGDVVGTGNSQTLTNKTLTAAVVNGLTVNTNITGDVILDDDTFAGATAGNIPTAESVKAYADASTLLYNALSKLTDTAITSTGIVLIKNTGTGLWESKHLSGDVTITSSGLVTANPFTVTKNTAVQELTNKTLTAPVINGGTVNNITALTVTGNTILTGDLTIDGITTTVDTTNLTVTDKLITLNKGGVSATSTGIEFEELGSVVGYIMVNGAGDKFLLKAPIGNILTVSTTSNKELTINGNLTVETDSYINQDLTTNSTAVQFETVTLGTSLVINGSFSGTGFKNESTMISNSATAAPSQASVKAYVDTQVASSGVHYASSLTGNDSYAITVSSFTTYTAGRLYVFKADVGNTGPATLAINTSTGKAIVKRYNQALVTGDILAGQLVEVVYDGTNFQMLTPVARPPLFKEAIFTVVTSTGTFDLDDKLSSEYLPTTEEDILCYVDTTYQARDTYTYDSGMHVITLDTEQPPDTKVVFLVQAWG